ncbi:CheR family methyltransferase [Desulfosoma caldarium]|uniref:Chemotaxis protein methyltransferase CheR n=1 Tax=Desulfosoma caldarium TaxID=610254 RepID=A0A3N1VNI2_9BACT|nr:CheR family methyltransferase [Desulfosoma caldarium]ROR01772.1 chemotaxis protein methyltransferase CheR [Desulfosoma caldarium]
MIHDADFQRVLHAFGLLWRGYRKVRKGAKRRLAALMQAQGVASVDDLLERCRHDAKLSEDVRRALAVSISRFFRDQKLWHVLERQVLPGIVGWSGKTVRIWSAGCARGEEVYSLKILWHEWAAAGAPLPKLELWATDFHCGLLEEARRGVYQRSSLKEVDAERQAAWFHGQTQGFFAVSDQLKEGILWRCHDMSIERPPSEGFHLVFLRNNLLTYYAPAVQRKAFAAVVDSLVEGGFLVLGRRERPPGGMWPLIPCAADSHLFRKVPFRSEFS